MDSSLSSVCLLLVSLSLLAVTYGSVSAGWECWPFHVTFLTNVELHCGKTRRARPVFSTVMSRY